MINKFEKLVVLTNKMEASDFATCARYGRGNTYLLIAFQSKAQFSYNGKEFFRIPKNSLVLYTPYSLQAYKGDGCVFVNSFMAFNVSDSFFDNITFPLNTVVQFTQNYFDEIISSLDKLSFAWNTDYEPAEKKNAPFEACKIIKRIDQMYKLIQHDYQSSKIEQFNEIREELTKSPVQNTVKVMAKKLGYTETYFGLCYKTLFGISPVHDRQIQLVALMKIYLETTNYSLEKIAELCGIESTSHMINIFKRHEKFTPHQYRLFIQHLNKRSEQKDK